MSGLLRICTAGSVDDGKSTLIGRLLYDSRAVYEDQVHSVEKASKNRDGRADRLLAVHRRAAGRARAGHHDRRRVPVLRDGAPQVHPRGHARPRAVHAQHGDRAPRRPTSRSCSSTRATACASQSRRHAQHRAAARHHRLRRWPSTRWTSSTSTATSSTASATSSRRSCRTRSLHPIPISALHGDNVITRSDRTPWFDGREPARVSRDRRGRPRASWTSRSGSPCSSSCGRATTSAATPARSCRASIRVGDADHGLAVAAGTATGQAHRHLGRRPRRGAARRCR